MTEENKDAAVALPEPDTEPCGGRCRSYSPERVIAYVQQATATLRAQLTASEASRKELREALRGIASLYDTDEGCRSMPEYIATCAALANDAEQKGGAL